MKRSLDEKILSVISYIVSIFLALICFIPFWLILVGSFSSEQSILVEGYSFLPRDFSLEAYELIFKIPKRVFTSYGVSIFITVVGGGISLFITAMTAFVLMRKDFKYRNFFAMAFYFPSIFSGGLVPTYIWMTKYLNLKDTIVALIIPLLLSAWNIFLMRNFMKDIPDSISESAKLDGANDFLIFARLYLPLCGPGLATIGLFIGLSYWNDWYNAMLYINKPNLFPLQYMLYQMLNNIKGMQDAAGAAGIPIIEMPSQTFKMAMAIVATGPILLLYPFVQRYFVQGLTVGSVKG